ncbi:MAG: hypothetical protein V1853_00280 [bacterium]
MKPLLGYSTGGAAYQENLSLNERIKLLRDLGCNAIELGFVRPERYENEPMSEIDIELLKSFSWVSLHAPGGNWEYQNDEKTKKLLSDIKDLHERYPLDLVVFHPDRFDDFAELNELPFLIAMENMDSAKKSFKKPSHLTSMFKDHPDWKLVIDLQHCYSLDKSMSDVQDFVDNYSDRLKEVQISGAGKVKPNAVSHVPLYNADQKVVGEALKKLTNYPIIIESPVPTKEDLEKEYQYILSFLK